ncbi:MAG: ChaN family lipoprotein [Acidobacteriota bacterium]|nr:ChaN family lipoprotein [Acidobacteriota bacterium]
MTQNFYAQMPLAESSYRVFDGQGKPASVNQVVDALQSADVVFLGEQHDDPTAHALQFEIFRQAFERYGKSRSVVLSLEMFERDVQLIVDEYLQGLINEANFIAASRAWNNYQTDYRPLIEFAKQNKLPVVAANAPRRYVNLVSRKGREALNQLSTQAKMNFAPLPFAPASKEYTAKFTALMGGGGMSTHGANLLDSQSLWDATMADSVAKILQSNKNALVVHLNGGFHTENRLGTVEHLLKYHPKARVLVVTIKSIENFPDFDITKDTNAGDFVILTDPKLPRSFKR